MCKPGCKCQQKTFTRNLSRGEVKFIKFCGRDTLIVPLIMAKEDVVMNNALVPLDQWEPMAWNGRPVTVYHPDDSGQFLSASSSPQAVEDWVVGQLMNARLDGGEFKADAYISVDRAEEVYPGLLKYLQSSKMDMDVSTGYFADVENASGELNGRKYEVVHKNIRPDHLALLPNEVGACSWADGCGVRNRRDLMSKPKNGAAALVAALTRFLANERGSPTDRGQMVADLISSDASPFLPEDMEGLNKMCDQSLQALCKQYLSTNADPPEPKEPDDTGDSEPDPNDPKEKQEMKKNEIEKLVSDGVANALKSLGIDAGSIATANKLAADHRASLISRIVANSSISKESAEKMDTATLETVANGLNTPSTDFSGRAIRIGNDVKDEDVIKAMSSTGVVASIINSRKKESA